MKTVSKAVLTLCGEPHRNTCSNCDVTVNEAFADDFQQKFEKELLTEIIPSIETNYRVVPDAKHRAMVGVSMGGMQTAFIGMNHP